MNRTISWIFIIASLYLSLGLALFVFGYDPTGSFTYGFTLFLFIPFVIGALTAALKTESLLQKEKSFLFRNIYWSCLRWAAVIILLLVPLLQEGAICILMALPLLVPLHLLGAYIGYNLAKQKYKNQLSVLLTFVFLMPSSFHLESQYFNEPTILTVETSVEINATPSEIWKVLLEPIEFGESPFFFFKAGVTYPKNMKVIEKEGKSYIACEYSNGQGLNPILKKIENRELQFTLIEHPVPMKELNPFGEVHAPHLNGYLKIYSGQVLIEEISEQKSRLTAKTIYHYNIHPVSYWKLWTQTLFDQMHKHVLIKIKEKSEQKTILSKAY